MISAPDLSDGLGSLWLMDQCLIKDRSTPTKVFIR